MKAFHHLIMGVLNNVNAKGDAMTLSWDVVRSSILRIFKNTVGGEVARMVDVLLVRFPSRFPFPCACRDGNSPRKINKINISFFENSFFSTSNNWIGLAHENENENENDSMRVNERCHVRHIPLPLPCTRTSQYHQKTCLRSPNNED